MRTIIAVLSFLLAACPRPNSGSPSSAPSQSPDHRSDDQLPTRATGWNHKRSSLVVGLGSARHSAVDAIVHPGSAAVVRGKFTYGKVGKDLQAEQVWLQVQRDGVWQPIESGVTDSDGRISLEVPAASLSGAGPHPFQFLVSGDLSAANGFIWNLERGAQVVVFDIDGTLTTGDSELLDDALGGDVDARQGAAQVVHTWAKAGYTIVYLTGRPYMYNRSTRAWLNKHRFPHGPLATANSLSDAIPTQKHVGAFKRDWLRALQRSIGVQIAAAYGNSSSDICAFAQAGIEPDATYIIGNDKSACEGFAQVHLIADYVQHGATLKLPPARTP